MKSWKWIGVLVLGAALAVGCGGDDDDDKANDGKDSSGKGGSSAGKGGSAGKPDNVLDVPDGGVACGKNVCKLEEGEENVTLCCADAFAGTCGMMQGMSGCVKRIANYPGCPAATGGGGMLRLPSCCTPDGQCGINGGAFAGGDTCTELSAAKMRAMEMGAGNFIMFPDPQACPDK